MTELPFLGRVPELPLPSLHVPAVLLSEPKAASFFRPIASERTYEAVIDQIGFAIRSGLLRLGETLPPIAVMAQLTGVSRSVVGQAIQVLRDAGVLETKRGATGGITVVREDFPSALARLGSTARRALIGDLLEARRPIEMELSIRAARHADQGDLETLADAVRRLERSHSEDGGGAEEFRHLNHVFHYAVGRAAKNTVLAQLQHQVHSRIAQLLNDRDFGWDERRRVLDVHQAMLAAIMHRDESAVERTTDNDLRWLEALIQRAELDCESQGVQ